VIDLTTIYAVGGVLESKDEKSMLSIGLTNAIGVYGKCLKIVRDRVLRGEAPKVRSDGSPSCRSYQSCSCVVALGDDR
jgi:hypothetical protein